MNGYMSIEDYVYWFIKYYVPVMVANGFPVLVKGSRRIDRDGLFLDGKPILGSNKTIEGFVVGLIGSYIASTSIGIVYMDPSLIPLLTGAGFFALIGDLIGAFIKRRLNIKPGDPAPLLDQLDFIALSTLYYIVIGIKEFVERPSFILISIVVIAILHIATNLLAYSIGLKHSKL